MNEDTLRLLMDDAGDDIPVTAEGGSAQLLRGDDFVDARAAVAPPPAAPSAPEGPSAPTTPTAASAAKPAVTPTAKPAVTPAKSTATKAGVTPPPAPVRPAPKPGPAALTAPAPVDPSLAEDLMLADEPEDKAEIAAIEQKMKAEATAKPAPAKGNSADFLAGQVDSAVADSRFKVKDEGLQRRFRTVVEMFFRDLRDAFETRQKLALSIASGGLGLKEAQVDAMMAGLEQKVEVYRSVMATQIAQQKKDFVAERQTKLQQADAKQATAEQDARNEMFERVTGKSAASLPMAAETPNSGDAPSAPPPASLPKPKPIPAAIPKVIPVKAVPKPAPPITKPAVEPKDSAAKPAMPVTKLAAEPKGSAAKPTPASKAPAVKPTPAPKPQAAKSATKPNAAQKPRSEGASVPVNLPTIDEIEEPTMLSTPDPVSKKTTKPVADLDGLFGDDGPVAASNQVDNPELVKPPAPKKPAPIPDKKIVSDVKFTPKLTGPVEELKGMRLEDFRYLSKDPKEATLKISDKIDLLQEEQFEMKIAGIKAWQDSPVNRLYLDILRSSLEGKPVVEVIKERQAMNDPVLSKPEFDAIMALNRKLRFG